MKNGGEYLGISLAGPSVKVDGAHARVSDGVPPFELQRQAVGILPGLPTTRDSVESTALLGELSPIALEDLHASRPLLRELNAIVAIRLEGDGRVHRLDPGCANDSGIFHLLEVAGSLTIDPTLEAPIHCPDGRRVATLALLLDSSTHSEPLRSGLQSLLAHTARSISERWFRLRHRTHWIVAATSRADPNLQLALAVDAASTLVGADFHARQFLETQGGRIGKLEWRDFFKPWAGLPLVRGPMDISTCLRSALDDEPWTAVLTPPYLRGHLNWTAHSLFHARPRYGRACTPAFIGPRTHSERLTLSSGARQKIEDYVESHLEHSVTVDSLARLVGLSTSHFSRAFRNSMKMTPHKYVMWRRLVHAQELITRSGARLADIAVSAGFADQSHLCRYFNESLGVSPSEFRRYCRS